MQAVAIMNKLAAELDIFKATDGIRSFILELLGCGGVTLFLVDSESKSLRFAPASQYGTTPWGVFLQALHRPGNAKLESSRVLVSLKTPLQMCDFCLILLGASVCAKGLADSN